MKLSQLLSPRPTKHDMALPGGTRFETAPKTGCNWNDGTAGLKPSSGSSRSGVLYNDIIPASRRGLDRSRAFCYARTDSAHQCPRPPDGDCVFSSDVRITDARNKACCASRTFRSSFMRHLNSVGELLGVEPAGRSVIMRSDRTTEVNGSRVWSVSDWACR